MKILSQINYQLAGIYEMFDFELLMGRSQGCQGRKPPYLTRM